MDGFALRSSVIPPPAPAGEAAVPSVSASQFKDFTRCQRLWWFHKVALVKEREKQHFVIGHALHGCAERFQIGTSVGQVYRPGWDKGLEEDQSAWVKKMVDYAISLGMWERIPGRLIEFPICMLVGHECEGLPLIARSVVYEDEKGVRKIQPPTCLVDGSPLPHKWNYLPHYNGFMDFLDLDMPAPLIGDHKSAKSRRYALTQEKLAQDVQMLCYSAAVISLLPGCQRVRLRHNVFLKDPAATTPAYPVDCEVDRASVVRHWAKVVAWSTEMQTLRSTCPAGIGPARADNWHKVTCAIQQGKPDECSGYGGCPFRDVCYGRCTSEQLLNRLDAPDPTILAKPPEMKFGLRPSSTPTQEKSMAFGRPAPVLAAGQDVYIIDPENAAAQYRARIDLLDAPPNPHAPSTVPETAIILWPHADIEPDFSSLGLAFRIIVPKTSLMVIPLATAKVMGYADALRSAGETQGLDWAPAVKAPSPAPAAVETASVPVKPAPDKAFGLRPSAATPATVTEVKVDPTPVAGTNAVVNTPAGGPEKCPLSNDGSGTRVGDVLEVAPSEAKFWKPLAGKSAKVVEITPGEIPGNVLFSVEIDGLPYPDVLPSRFMVVAKLAYVFDNVGKMAHMVLDKGMLTLNTAIEAADKDGMTILAGTRKVLWSEIQTIELFDEKKHIPISDKDAAKAAEKVAKAEAKAQAKEEKAAAKAASPAGAVEPAPAAAETVLASSASPLEALNAAIAAVELALQAGKTTRKVVEALMPPLKAVKEVLLGGLAYDSVPVPPAPPAGAGDPVMRGAVKVALTHAIGVLNEALGKIPE